MPSTLITKQKSYPIYTANDIQAWEARWFALGNASYSLMQQAALMMANNLERWILTTYTHLPTVAIWCGTGNNGGDGYVLARLLFAKKIAVIIYAPNPPKTSDAQLAKNAAQDCQIPIYTQRQAVIGCDVHIDALFGIGLKHTLSQAHQDLIQAFNAQRGKKIAVDIPSGLHPDTGVALPVAVKADISLCVMGLKMGLLTAQGKHHAGQVMIIPLIPDDHQLQPMAYINTKPPTLSPRNANVHKGNFGHVLIIGGAENMGGAVIMAGEAAMATGAGKVTIMCHHKHHTAILSRNPSLMVKDIEDNLTDTYLQQIDSVAFGMGLGRDTWSENIYHTIINRLTHATHLACVVLDADGLYFLAKYPKKLTPNWIATPHNQEAARLLQQNADDIAQNRPKAIYQLSQRYLGNWVLKGAGSLSLTTHPNQKPNLQVCAFGNAGMATAGMGDVLSGMIASLSIQNLSLADCVALHALAGDKLAQAGQIGINASDMPKAIHQVINQS